MATCPPKQVEAIAERVAATGRRFVDSPVSGGVVGATAGSLTIMAAAPADVFEAARPVLEAMGSRTLHVGDRPGQGATVKTVNQLLCGVHIVVAAEALSLAERVGVDTSDDARHPDRHLRRQLDAAGPRPAHARGGARR